MKFKIGDTLLDNNVFLAPMAGVTDLPFRLLCREQGAGMSVTEMVSAKAILYKNKNTKELLAVDPAEGPVSVQLFGSDPEIMAAIAARIEDGPYVAIDVNMGCPVPKIVNNRRRFCPDERSGPGRKSAYCYGKGSEKAGDCKIP